MKNNIVIKHAFAGLKQAPGFSLTIILTLALTLGALLAAFNINQLISFKSLPYPDAKQLHFLQQNYVSGGKDNIGGQMVAGQYHMYREGKELFTSALVSQQRGILLSAPSKPMLIGLYVSHEYFSLLGVKFVQGQALNASSDVNSAEKEVVISYQLWQSQFNGRADIVGQSLQFQDNYYRIVGVVTKSTATPAPFVAYGKTDLYLPMAFSGFDDKNWRSAPRNLTSLVKLAPEQQPTQVMAQLNKIIADNLALTDAAKQYQGKEIKAHLTKLSDEIKGDSEKITLLVLAGAVALLLIAFANVINLYLAHIAKKQQLLAICASIGAKPKVIFKQLFIESLLLTFTATAFALIIAAWLLVYTQALAVGSLPRLNELHIDTGTIIFSFMMAILLAALLAFFARFSVNYNELKSQLTASGKGASAQISKKIRYLLIVSQIAITGVLLISSAILLQKTLSTANKPLGFNEKNVLSFQIDASDKYKTRAEKLALLEEIKQHFLSLAQVSQVSKNLIPPIRVGNFSTVFEDSQGNAIGSFGYNTIDRDYFSLLEHPFVYGRNFTIEEISERQPKVIISESVAMQAFGRLDVLGEYVHLSPEYGYEIIGVVKDYFNAYTHQEFTGHAYFTLNGSRLNMLLKLKNNNDFTQADIIEQLAKLDSSLRVLEYLSLSDTKADLVAKYRLAAWLAGSLSILALILACTGIYGVISYTMHMRRYELGVRMAVGAKKIKIMLMLVKELLSPLLTGIVISLLLATLVYLSYYSALATWLAQDNLQLFSTTMLILAVMLFSALLACIIPVQKIINNDPIKALKNE